MWYESRSITGSLFQSVGECTRVLRESTRLAVGVVPANNVERVATVWKSLDDDSVAH